MESVGSQLREARLKLELTLEQISAKTRISLRILQGIEQDDLTGISSPFFYRSYVRQFAEQVGLDYALLAPLVQNAASTLPEPLMPGQVEFVPQKLSPLRASRPKNLRWLLPLGALAFMLIGCSTLYALWENARAGWRHTSLAAIAALPNHTAGQTNKSAAPNTTLTGTKATLAPPAPLQSRPDVPKPAFHVEISAIQSTWISMVADGKEIFRGVMGAAETKAVDGHDVARIRTGNAGVTNFVFNGKRIGILGAAGETQTVVFTRNNYQVLEPAPRIALTHFSLSAE